MNEKNKSTISSRTIRCFWRLVRLGMPEYLLSFTGSLMSISVNFIGALSSGLLLKIAADAAEGSSGIMQQVLTVFSITLAGVFLCVTGSILNARWALRIRSKIQKKMTRRWISQDEQAAKPMHTGDAITRFTNDIGELEDFYFQGFSGIVLSPFANGVAALLTVWAISPAFAGIASVAGVATTILYALFSNRVHRLETTVHEQNARTSESFSDIVTGMLPIRVAHLGRFALDQYAKAVDDHMRSSKKSIALNGWINAGAGLIHVLAIVITLLLGIAMALKGIWKISDVLLAASMQPLITRMIGSFGSSWNYLTRLSVAGERVFEVLDTPLETNRTIPPFDQNNSSGLIEFDHVTFYYENSRVWHA